MVLLMGLGLVQLLFWLPATICQEKDITPAKPLKSKKKTTQKRLQRNALVIVVNTFEKKRGVKGYCFLSNRGVKTVADIR